MTIERQLVNETTIFWLSLALAITREGWNRYSTKWNSTSSRWKTGQIYWRRPFSEGMDGCCLPSLRVWRVVLIFWGCEFFLLWRKARAIGCLLSMEVWTVVLFLWWCRRLVVFFLWRYGWTKLFGPGSARKFGSKHRKSTEFGSITVLGSND